MSKRTTIAVNSNRRSKKPRPLARTVQQEYGPCWNGTTSDSKTITILVKHRDLAFHYDAETSRLDLVQDVWEFKIIPFFNVKELALLRPTCRWWDEQWQEFLKRNTLRVPEQAPTIDEAMRVGFNLSKQKVYSKEKPLSVVLSEGEHVVGGSWTTPSGFEYENTLDITCSNISFIGHSKDKTTVHGGIGVVNKKNVTVKSLTLTNPKKSGLSVRGEEASVEMVDVFVTKCKSNGLYVTSGASVKATHCEFSENRGDGVVTRAGSQGFFTNCTIHHNIKFGVIAAEKNTLVELRGEHAETHHNGDVGLVVASSATINIYMTSRPISTLVHDNKKDDFDIFSGGKILYHH